MPRSRPKRKPINPAAKHKAEIARSSLVSTGRNFPHRNIIAANSSNKTETSRSEAATVNVARVTAELKAFNQGEAGQSVGGAIPLAKVFGVAVSEVDVSSPRSYPLVIAAILHR